MTGGVDYEVCSHKISIGITPEDSCDSFVRKICGDTTVHQLGLGICARCGLLVACSNCLHSSNRGDYRLCKEDE